MPISLIQVTDPSPTNLLSIRRCRCGIQADKILCAGETAANDWGFTDGAAPVEIDLTAVKGVSTGRVSLILACDSLLPPFSHVRTNSYSLSSSHSSLTLLSELITDGEYLGDEAFLMTYLIHIPTSLLPLLSLQRPARGWRRVQHVL